MADLQNKDFFLQTYNGCSAKFQIVFNLYTKDLGSLFGFQLFVQFSKRAGK